jgi:hypothetical protein
MNKSNDASIISPDGVESQAFNVVRRSLVRAISSADLPVFLDIYSDFIIGEDGEPFSFSQQTHQQKGLP